MTRRKPVWIASGIIGIAALTIFYVARRQTPTAEPIAETNFPVVTPTPFEAPPSLRRPTGSGSKSLIEGALVDARKSGKPVFIDFYATWCGPCKLLDKAYEKPALKTAASHYIVVKVDVDEYPEDARKYGVQAMPTMVFLSSSGQVLSRKEGFAVPNDVRTEEGVVNVVAKDVAQSMDWIRKNKA